MEAEKQKFFGIESLVIARQLGIELTPPFKDPNAREFLMAARDDGAHLKLPPRTSEANWTRQENIVVIYYSSPLILDELRDLYPVSRERLRQILRKGLFNLHRNCSPEVRAQHPLEGLEIEKPRDILDGIRLSWRHESNLIPILLDYQSSQNLEELYSKYDSNQIFQARRAGQEWGVQIPIPRMHRLSKENDAIEEGLMDRSKKPEEIQQLLDQVTRTNLNRVLSSDQEILASLGNLLINSGIHAKPDRFVLYKQLLERSGVPLTTISYTRLEEGIERPVRYYIIAAIHQSWAIEVLKGNHSS